MGPKDGLAYENEVGSSTHRLLVTETQDHTPQPGSHALGAFIQQAVETTSHRV